MDGNGRWATARGLPRSAGHQQGGETVRRIIEAAPGCGIGTLTLYAFSSDNWKRPKEEIHALFGLLERYLLREVSRCVEEGVRICVIGRRDRLPARLVRLIERAEAMTAHCETLRVRIAVDYSSRDLLLRAAERCASTQDWSRTAFSAALGACEHGVTPAPDVDLLIRTGGEQRLSDFLLWECAYAEMFFVPEMWPDFTADALRRVVDQFRTRDRRFGRAPNPAPAPELQPEVVPLYSHSI